MEIKNRFNLCGGIIVICIGIPSLFLYKDIFGLSLGFFNVMVGAINIVYFGVE